MSKRHKRDHSSAGARANNGKVWVLVVLVIAAGAALAFWVAEQGKKNRSAASSNPTDASSTNKVAAAPIPTNEVAQAIMVTQELDFGGPPPSIRDALKDIERRHDPEDGVGRTFSMLDAYGEPTPDGKKLHISMHISMEKPGIGSLVFKRTGEVLWKTKIIPPVSSTPQPKTLTILMTDNSGKTVMLDGTKGATRVMDVPLQNSTTTVREVWPDGEEREFTFTYSICGCPVKAKVRRIGELTARTTELPVMFPDDPDALATIARLMGWPTPQ
jgi:hypothetical protein